MASGIEFKKTPLYDLHESAGGKMVPFAGWSMPLSFTGIIEEHRATRTGIGLFDVSHMGRIEVTGPGASGLLNRVGTIDAEKLKPLSMGYCLFCNEQGGILDDVMVYRLGEQRFFVCANASNAVRIFEWMTKEAGAFSPVQVSDRTVELAQVAVQGSLSAELVGGLVEFDLTRVGMRECAEGRIGGFSGWLSRSGYTGERGFEIYLPSDHVAGLWEALLDKGRSMGARPCGLGCRDTLRLEMGYPLYGNDIDETTTPLEASLDFAVDFKKDDFIGYPVLAGQKKNGIGRRLIGFELEERGVPRKGCSLFSGDGVKTGEVTSGNHSPMLNRGIGMGYVRVDDADVGTPLTVDIRGRRISARIVKRPFYRRKPVPA
ncbi:MAG TPA: glycine cleavage system aminomethyltransferase GcvT [Nitrospiria bacterium]